MGDGEIGVGGIGDLKARLVAAEVVGRASASLGRAARASMIDENCTESEVLHRGVNRDEFCRLELSPVRTTNK